MQDYDRVLDPIRAAGGEVVGLTSAPQSQADDAAAEWKIRFPLVSDPSCALVGDLNRRGLLTSVVDRSVAAEGGFFNEAVGGGVQQYSTGMLQPGVVALQGPADSPVVLLSWGCTPTTANIGGAVGRLPPRKAWATVQRSLAGDFSGARLTGDQANDSAPLPVFVTLLMANGNFLHPKTFTQTLDGRGDTKILLRRAMAKVALACAAVGLGLVKAPKETLGLLLAYGVYFRLGPYRTIMGTFAKQQEQPSPKL